MKKKQRDQLPAGRHATGLIQSHVAEAQATASIYNHDIQT